MKDKIQFKYKDVNIEFDIYNEEWVASFEVDLSNKHIIYKRNKSLKSLKEAVDRFVTNNFTPIPISYFDNNLNFVQAEITSFTEKEGDCWIKFNDGRRTLLTVNDNRMYSKKIYAAGNINNEEKLLKIFDLSDQKTKIEHQLEQIKKEIILTIDSLEKYDIAGLQVFK